MKPPTCGLSIGRNRLDAGHQLPTSSQPFVARDRPELVYPPHSACLHDSSNVFTSLSLLSHNSKSIWTAKHEFGPFRLPNGPTPPSFNTEVQPISIERTGDLSVHQRGRKNSTSVTNY